MDMRAKYIAFLALLLSASTAPADDLTTLDGQNYQDIRDVSVKPNGLHFVVGDDATMRGVTVALTNLPPDIKEKYHCDGYSLGMMAAREDQIVDLKKSMAFSLDQLPAAEKEARDQKKLLGFILVWNQFFTPARPMGLGSTGALAHFYDVFHDNLVLVFVSHETEREKVPDSVKAGFNGPDEGGYSPSMAVVTADCSKFICEVPYSAKDFAGREQIFHEKIAVIKKFLADNPQ